MKRTALLLAFVAIPSIGQAQGNPGVEAAKANFGIMSNYFTRAAEAMSEADYAYKPVATVRSVGELVGHVAGAQNMMCAIALGETPKSEDDIEKAAKTKAALVAALKASNEYCARAYALTDANAPGRRWTSDSFAVCSSSGVTGRDPTMPRSSFMNSMRPASVVSPTNKPFAL